MHQRTGGTDWSKKANVPKEKAEDGRAHTSVSLGKGGLRASSMRGAGRQGFREKRSMLAYGRLERKKTSLQGHLWIRFMGRQ